MHWILIVLNHACYEHQFVLFCPLIVIALYLKRIYHYSQVAVVSLWQIMGHDSRGDIYVVMQRVLSVVKWTRFSPNNFVRWTRRKWKLFRGSLFRDRWARPYADVCRSRWFCVEIIAVIVECPDINLVHDWLRLSLPSRLVEWVFL